ncbi:MAG: hypothetical protein KUG78_00490 [Kangiellaceae bacterium]|nr:hypothetical protein [Kangiellaceae bacterium]
MRNILLALLFASITFSFPNKSLGSEMEDLLNKKPPKSTLSKLIALNSTGLVSVTYNQSKVAPDAPTIEKLAELVTGTLSSQLFTAEIECKEMISTLTNNKDHDVTYGTRRILRSIKSDSVYDPYKFASTLFQDKSHNIEEKDRLKSFNISNQSCVFNQSNTPEFKACERGLRKRGVKVGKLKARRNDQSIIDHYMDDPSSENYSFLGQCKQIIGSTFLPISTNESSKNLYAAYSGKICSSMAEVTTCYGQVIEMSDKRIKETEAKGEYLLPFVELNAVNKSYTEEIVIFPR